MDNASEILAAINNLEEKGKKSRDLTVLYHFILLIAVIGIVATMMTVPPGINAGLVVGYIVLAELIAVHLIRMKEK